MRGENIPTLTANGEASSTVTTGASVPVATIAASTRPGSGTVRRRISDENRQAVTVSETKKPRKFRKDVSARPPTKVTVAMTAAVRPVEAMITKWRHQVMSDAKVSPK